MVEKILVHGGASAWRDACICLCLHKAFRLV